MTVLFLSILVFAAASPFIALAAGLPAALVLPVISLGAVAGAGLFALAALRTGSTPRRGIVTSWDIAGALTFIGCAAAVLGEAEYAVEYLLGQRNK